MTSIQTFFSPKPATKKADHGESNPNCESSAHHTNDINPKRKPLDISKERIDRLVQQIDSYIEEQRGKRK